MDSTTAALAYRIRRLSRAQLRALVANLWSTRGQEAVGRDDVSVDGRGLRAVRVRIDGSATRAETVVDDRRLAEMLQYAVEPTETERLCESYLGAPPADLSPSPVTRGWRALTALRNRASHVRRRLATPGSATPPAAVVGLFLLVVGAVALAGLPADQQPDSGDAPADDAVAPSVGSTPDGGAVGSAGGTGDQLYTMEFPPDYPPSPALFDDDLQLGIDGRSQDGKGDDAGRDGGVEGGDEGADGREGCAPSRLQPVEGSTGDDLYRYSCQ